MTEEPKRAFISMFNRNDFRKSKKKKRRKSSINDTAPNSKTIGFLSKHTRFDEDEISEWYKVFQGDCPEGRLYKSKIIDMYSMIIPKKNATVLVNHIFRVFDQDDNGFIDFKEFMLATDMTSCGSPDEQLRWAFKMYDEDGSGNIEKQELQEMITSLLEIQGMSTDVVSSKISELFSTLDLNGDGLISEDEFIKKCQEGQIMPDKKKKINEIQKTQNKRKDETNDSMVKIDDERGQLKQNDLDYLCNFTRFDKTEILDWFRCFIFDCPSGSLRKEKVLEMYTMILPEKNAQVFVNHIFRVFDRDNNGCIDFKEFMLATDMTTGGTVEEKLRWAFKMYDKDGSGKIEHHEMEEIIMTLYELNGASSESGREAASKLFRKIDQECTGEVDEEQFVSCCSNDPRIIYTISNNQSKKQ